jgi:hypothetical protein
MQTPTAERVRARAINGALDRALTERAELYRLINALSTLWECRPEAQKVWGEVCTQAARFILAASDFKAVPPTTQWAPQYVEEFDKTLEMLARLNDIVTTLFNFAAKPTKEELSELP